MAIKRREKTAFGIYLVRMIKDAGISQEEFYTKVGIKKPYFYDILKGSPPPRETLERINDVLDELLTPDETRRRTLLNLASQYRGEIPSDIHDLIISHPDQWDIIRVTLNQLLSSNNK